MMDKAPIIPASPAGSASTPRAGVEIMFVAAAGVSEKTGLPAYVVGGYVRDQLMLKCPKSADIDIVVLGDAIAFAKAFDEEMKQVGHLVEFPEFGTARYAIEGGLDIEFTTARSEEYDPSSRKPTVALAPLEDDLGRRDFTVNAMARRIGEGGELGDIADPHGGQKDLDRKLLRTPLDPDITFFDDPLRMLRAARFVAQLGLSADSKTYEAMKRNAGRLSIVSAERVRDELFKLLSAPRPSVGLMILHETGLMRQFFPEISGLSGVEDVYGYSHKDNLSHTFAVVDNVAASSEKTTLRFAGLVHDIAKPRTKKFLPGRGWTFDMHEHLGKKMVQTAGKRLRMSAEDIKYAGKLVRWHLQPIALMDEGITDSAVRRLVVNVGEDLADLLILCRSDITTGNPAKKARRLANYDRLEERIAAVIEKDKLRAFQSPVRGEEIMKECGLKPGPTVGRIKDAIEEAILAGEIPNEYEAARGYFLKVKDRYCGEAVAWERI